MKHTLTMLLMALLLPVAAHAQSTPQAKARVAKIREMYAAAKERPIYLKEAELPKNEMTITNEYMAAGAGPIKETYRYQYSGDFNEEFGGELYTVHFITRQHNVGARDFYEESLYDDDGTPAFYYEKTPDGEFRYYFDKGKVVHKVVKGTDPREEYDADCLLLQRYCSELVSAFNLLMNRNWE